MARGLVIIPVIPPDHSPIGIPSVWSHESPAVSTHIGPVGPEEAPIDVQVGSHCIIYSGGQYLGVLCRTVGGVCVHMGAEAVCINHQVTIGSEKSRICMGCSSVQKPSEGRCDQSDSHISCPAPIAMHTARSPLPGRRAHQPPLHIASVRRMSRKCRERCPFRANPSVYSSKSEGPNQLHC